MTKNRKLMMLVLFFLVVSVFFGVAIKNNPYLVHQIYWKVMNGNKIELENFSLELPEGCVVANKDIGRIQVACVDKMKRGINSISIASIPKDKYDSFKNHCRIMGDAVLCARYEGVVAYLISEKGLAIISTDGVLDELFYKVIIKSSS